MNRIVANQKKEKKVSDTKLQKIVGGGQNAFTHGESTSNVIKCVFSFFKRC